MQNIKSPVFFVLINFEVKQNPGISFLKYFYFKALSVKYVFLMIT